MKAQLCIGKIGWGQLGTVEDSWRQKGIVGDKKEQLGTFSDSWVI